MKHIFCLSYGIPQGETERRLMDCAYIDSRDNETAAKSFVRELEADEATQDFPMDCEFVIREERY